MTFEDLPVGWADHSLDDQALLADVVDLFVRDADRRAGTLMALLTDDRLRLVTPVAIDDVPTGCDAYDQHRTVTGLVRVLEEVSPGGGIALAVARRGRVVQTRWDRGWRSALAMACAEGGVTDLGCYLATPSGLVRLADDISVAA